MEQRESQKSHCKYIASLVNVTTNSLFYQVLDPLLPVPSCELPAGVHLWWLPSLTNYIWPQCSELISIQQYFFTSIYLLFLLFFFYIGHKVIIKCSGKGILGVYNPKLNVFVFIFVPGTFNTILKQKKLQIKSSLKPCLTTTYDNYHLYNCEGLANTLFHAYACNFSNLNNTFLDEKINLTGQNSE